MLGDWRGLLRFRSLPAEKRAIVIYSEGRHDWPHLAPLVHHLAGTLEKSICYVSSELGDPGLALNNMSVIPIRIGQRTARTVFFLALDADLIVMTMPDLNTFHIKRSIRHPVHYVYVFHSIVSTHMIYRKAAFDHYDTIFCVGPHHMREIRETESLYGLHAKNLFEHGYGRLDTILEHARRRNIPGQNDSGAPRVLIAPSWGAGGILETCGSELVDALVGSGCQVVVRPHPQLRLSNPKLFEFYRKRSAGQVQVVYEDDVVSHDSLHYSDVIISDWSGIAFEYAFGLERPVLFIDVPRKVNNPEYTRYANYPIEASLRSEIGEVLPVDRIAEAPVLVRQLIAERAMRSRHLAELRQRYIFNVGSSGARGAEKIGELADCHVPRSRQFE
jgi:hypothetical protein